MGTQATLEAAHRRILSEETKEKVERVVLTVSILSYGVHLGLILLNNLGWINLAENFLTNPIAAIYTPFSFILVYEVFLLIFFLPNSITIYIGKQYEIITLIVIRRIFKDIAYVDLDSRWFQNKYDLQFTYDIVTSVVLFALIYFFYRQAGRKNYQSIKQENDRGQNIRKFVLLKKGLALLLLPVLIALAVYTFTNWAIDTIDNSADGIYAFKNINNVFYDTFFTVLIIADVLLLLFSFFYSDKFYKIIRNSGFVISTILIKISFAADGIINNVLIIGALVFGCLMLVIHNLYLRAATDDKPFATADSEK
ncbi:MAG: hypothetical protein AAFZ52_11990 [Bacteroidota bacterium]